MGGLSRTAAARAAADRKGKAWLAERSRKGGIARWAKRAINPVCPLGFCLAGVRYHVASAIGRPGQAMMLAKIAEVERWLADLDKPSDQPSSLPPV